MSSVPRTSIGPSGQPISLAELARELGAAQAAFQRVAYPGKVDLVTRELVRILSGRLAHCNVCRNLRLNAAIKRLRSVLDTVSLHHSDAGSRVLVVGHQVIVLCLRYLIEELTEDEILAIDRNGEVANCGVTSYTLDRHAAPGGRLRLNAYNFVAPLEQAGAPVTSRPDAPAGAK